MFTNMTFTLIKQMFLMKNTQNNNIKFYALIIYFTKPFSNRFFHDRAPEVYDLKKPSQSFAAQNPALP